jgi:hypothetical protein
MTAMTDPACRPPRTLAPIAEPERSDRLTELLECMADLLVEARRQRLAIAEPCDGDDLRVRDAIARGRARALARRSGYRGRVGSPAASAGSPGLTHARRGHDH